jgi:hypothetical protein
MRSQSLLAGFLTLVLLLPGSGGVRAAGAIDAIREATYHRLDAVRAKKKAQLAAYLHRIRGLAAGVRNDGIMQDFFRLRAGFHRLGRKAPPPPEAAAAVESLEAAVREHYLRRYLAFYDILFVDRDGTVFHTIRQEGDCGRNLFGGALADTRLGRHLRDRPDERFVDFEVYPFSDEPSAFFVEPVPGAEGPEGWIVLQCAINKINDIFVRDPGLGRTGEAFLVNRHQKMLTQSRFRPGESILRQHLSEANITSKFRERKGHKIVTDYRGYRALSSFEVFPILGCEWLLIAKIDEDEVLTRHYLANRAALEDRLIAAVSAPPAETAGPADWPAHPRIVDIDEFRKAEGAETLATFGVTTCTAILVELPGRFGYLGHASTYDRIYGSGDMDLLGHMLNRIHTFEIYPYEARALRACVIAPHRNSIRHALGRLLGDGFLLSQIRFLHDSSARSASVLYNAEAGGLLVEWKGDAPEGQDPPRRLMRARDATTFGSALRELLSESIEAE